MLFMRTTIFASLLFCGASAIYACNSDWFYGSGPERLAFVIIHAPIAHNTLIATSPTPVAVGAPAVVGAVVIKSAIAQDASQSVKKE
ncbi:MAG: hypothetical protein WC707_02095 [Candidatus Babeliaceae bacterium]